MVFFNMLLCEWVVSRWSLRPCKARGLAEHELLTFWTHLDLKKHILLLLMAMFSSGTTAQQ